MNFQKFLIPIAALAVLGLAYQTAGWQGVLLVLGGIVFWMLLHFNRVVQALKRAADRPVGYVDSAVMLNAKLKSRSSLLHVVAVTRSLGEQLSPKDEQPEIFRWTDDGDSSVVCTFSAGKLSAWQLVRPEAEPESLPQTPAP